MSAVAVTGAAGFIGSALVARLVGMGRWQVIGLHRGHPVRGVVGARNLSIGDLPSQAGLAHLLAGIETLVHAAARVHMLSDTAADPLQEFRRVNVQGTMDLARQAAAAGVRRFVFISSIKVNGEFTAPGHPFLATDPTAPEDAYAISKMEAEAGLREIATATGMEWVVVRPPLVYGPGVKGNFETLMRWVARGLPLPLAAIDNQRSLIALENLVDLLALCIDHPAAANRTLLVSDGEDLSTPDLLRRLGKALGRPARLFPVPAHWLRWGASLSGKEDAVARLYGSLQIDLAATREALAWSPPIRVDEGLQRVANWFQNQS